MARQRMLHPDYFTNADLLSLSPLHRILFAGLWCLADREGRLRDKPRDIKIRVLPGDVCDVDQMLSDLAREGMVVRYVSGHQFLLFIPGFADHQKPHKNEVQSELPGPMPEEVQKKPANGRSASDTFPKPEVAQPSVGSNRAETETVSKTESETVLILAGKKPPAKVEPPKPPSDPPDLEHQAIIDSLVAIFEGHHGAKYGFDGRDAKAVKAMRGRADKAEILTRWRRAVRLTHPTVDNIWQLPKAWNRCARDDPSKPSAFDFDQGIISARRDPPKPRRTPPVYVPPEEEIQL